ncbi:MAG TPA: MaoC/PaaZ C-terminal domain-containing protein [Nitriliruptorales bacterium]
MLRLEAVGTWSDEHELAIPAARARAYAAATNDPLAPHADGKLVPPILTYPIMSRAQDQAYAPVAPEGVPAPGLHGEHDFRWHRPVRADETVRTKAAVVGVHAKRSGTTVVVQGETRDAAGDLVVEQYVTVFYPGYVNPDSAGEEAPQHGFPEGVRDADPLAVIQQRVDDDQTWRFAGPSRDCNPIHLDDRSAREAGLPGIINHGMCTLAIAGHGLVTELAAGDPTRLARLAVRFSRPVIPGQTLTTRVWQSPTVGTYQFETTDGSGTTVMKDGLLEVSPA